MPDSTVTLVGNLTTDPELRYTAAGAPLASFGVAVTRRKKVGDAWEEKVSFFDVTAWRELAENVAESLRKGTRVVVTGRLEQRSWQSKDGATRTAVEVVADEVAPSLRWATAAVTRNERTETTRQTAGAGAGRAVAAGFEPEPW